MKLKLSLLSLLGLLLVCTSIYASGTSSQPTVDGGGEPMPGAFNFNGECYYKINQLGNCVLFCGWGWDETCEDYKSKSSCAATPDKCEGGVQEVYPVFCTYKGANFKCFDLLGDLICGGEGYSWYAGSCG